MHIYTHTQRPDFTGKRAPLQNSWPEFMHYDEYSKKYWERLYTDFPDYQFYICDDDENLLAEGNSLPIIRDENSATLPLKGWDWAFESTMTAVDRGRTGEFNAVFNAVSAIAAVVHPDHRGKGLSPRVIQAMRDIAQKKGFKTLVAPVRPSLKHRYPLIPSEDYITWTREDGSLFDAWLRVHEKLGAKIINVASESMLIKGTAAQWKAWTGLHFITGGQYVVPGALIPIVYNREKDEGRYIEPNVWMLHKLD